MQAGTDLQAKVVEDKFHPKHVGAIISPLPGQDPAPVEQNFKNSYGRYGTKVDFQVMTTSESDCNSHLLQIKNANPDFLVLPAPSNNFLLCIQAAQSQNYYPGSGLGGRSDDGVFERKDAIIAVLFERRLRGGRAGVGAKQQWQP